MRLARTVALVGVGVLWWAVGPLVLVLAAATLYFRPVRAWLRPTRRVALIWVAGVLVLGGLAWLVPDGWVRMPPGPGALVTPAYVGRPVVAHADRVDAPLGESPRVTTRSYGIEECREVGFDDHGRLVTVCGTVLRLLHPDSLRQLASKELPGGCAPVFEVAGARVLVATGDRRILEVATADADGEPDLTTAEAHDLTERVPEGDCVTGLAPRGRGGLWFATAGGRVGLVAAGGPIRVHDLGDSVARPIAATTDGVYVAGAAALHKVTLHAGRPVVAWVAAYDEGGERGSAPVVLPSGLVALADVRRPRLQVVVHRGDTGAVVCRAEVFGDDAGATDGGLVAAGDGLLVQNSHGYAGPHSTLLGRTTTGGIARVDVAAQECAVTWESDLDAPSGAPAVSTSVGLAYAYTKRHSWLGVDAWYLTAIDLDTGRTAWSRRAGLGVLPDNHHGAVTLGPDGSAYVPALGGFVRVRDRG